MAYDVNNKKEFQYPHRCGQCLLGFSTEEEYLTHTCDTTGFKPTEPEHLGEDFVAVSEAALTRGNRRAELEAEGHTEEKAQEIAHEEAINPPQE